MSGGSTDALVSMGALVPGYVSANGEYWRLVTAMFLHGGLLHIAFNMYALYIGGSFLETISSRGKYIAIYLVAGLTGNVAVLVLAPAFSVTIGASTAIFGIFGALFVYSLHHRDTAVGRALRSMGTLILINLAFTFLVPGISWQGHIGGLIGGVAALEAVTWFGQRDLRAPIGPRDAALLAVRRRGAGGHRRVEHGGLRRLTPRGDVEQLTRDIWLQRVDAEGFPTVGAVVLTGRRAFVIDTLTRPTDMDAGAALLRDEGARPPPSGRQHAPPLGPRLRERGLRGRGDRRP